MTLQQFNLEMKLLPDRLKMLVMSVCPVKTGNMQNAIYVKVYSSGTSITGLDIIVDTNKAPYFKYTDSGGPNMDWFSIDAFDLVSRYIAARFGSSVIKAS